MKTYELQFNRRCQDVGLAVSGAAIMVAIAGHNVHSDAQPHTDYTHPYSDSSGMSSGVSASRHYDYSRPEEKVAQLLYGVAAITLFSGALLVAPYRREMEDPVPDS